MLSRALNGLKARVPEVACGVLLLILAMTVWLGARYFDQARWVHHTLEVETALSETWALLQDSEIGQRSYVLTGEDSFLEPFNEAKVKLPDALDRLRRLVSDNAEQDQAVEAVIPLIGRRVAFADETIAARRQQGFEAARDKVLERVGLNLMEEIDSRFETMRKSEQLLLAAREAAAQSTVTVLTLALGLAFFGTIGALATWIVNARRSTAELAAANLSLKQQIAEREAAEDQIRQMHKAEAIGNLTGGIAHDFNNMLAVVISGIGLAQKRLARSQEGAEEFLVGALDGANRAATLVKRLLAFSRQQPLAPKPMDANRFVAGISELITRAIGESINVETILGGGLWTTQADPVQLENAILNLCVNARDAMPDGGRLTIETANCHLD
ncbi:MAG: CHASE3 domain-containing protein, partial [Hyphomicrobium sp.]